MGVAWVGMELITMRPAGDAMITTIWSGASSWALTALPLFIWMGEILYRTRLSEDMFRGLAPWMRYLPRGLLHTNIVGCTIFAAVSGSLAATLNRVGKMSIPELRERGYPEFMIIVTLAGAATLGLMIPPSLTLIVYGVTINESITKLFMAGVFPGLVLAGLFMLYIMAWDYMYPDQRPEPERKMSFSERMAESRFLLPLLALAGFALFGLAASPCAIAFTLMLAAPSVTGSPNISIWLVIGAAFVTRHIALPELEGAGRDALDWVMSIGLAVIVIGLMSALGPAIKAVPWEVGTWLVLVFLVSFGLQVVAHIVLRTSGGEADAAPFALVAGNRNVALFLVALPVTQSPEFLIFLGCYQIPMCLTAILMRPLLGKPSTLC